MWTAWSMDLTKASYQCSKETLAFRRLLHRSLAISRWCFVLRKVYLASLWIACGRGASVGAVPVLWVVEHLDAIDHVAARCGSGLDLRLFS